jgi:hypothetical protein
MCGVKVTKKTRQQRENVRELKEGMGSGQLVDIIRVRIKMLDYVRSTVCTIHRL